MRALVLLLPLLLLAPAAARADRALTLDEALQLARQNNRDLKAAKARLDQARVGIQQAWVGLLPQLSAQGKYTHNYREVTLDTSSSSAGLLGLADTLIATSNNPAQTAGLGLYKQAVIDNTPTKPIVIQKQEQLDAVVAAVVPVVVPWAYQNLFAARHIYGSAQATYAVNVMTVLLAAAQSFYAAAGTDQLLVARRHAIELARQTLDNAKVRLDSGVVTKIEVTRAQLALLRAEQAEAESLDARAQVYRSLATILELREPFHVTPPESGAGTETEAGAAPAPAAELAKQALRLRPEFAVLELSKLAASEQASSALMRWLPTLSAFANLRVFNYAGFSGDPYAWAIGATLDWTIYDGGAREAQYSLALAQRRESEARLSLLRDTVVDELLNSEQALATRKRALDTARRSVELARETLDLARVQHNAGTASQLDVLQAQDALVLSEVAVVQARFDLALARLALERAAGTFPAATATEAAK